MADPQSAPQIAVPDVAAVAGSASVSNPDLESGALAARFVEIRDYTQRLSAVLDPEDCGAQSMPNTSPTKWHLAHTTWFFETFVLAEHVSNYKPFHPAFGFLFNSYYNGVGNRHTRSERGVLTRPALAEILDYRAHVDEQIQELLNARPSRKSAPLKAAIETGLQHEQQHQELILTDIKHLFAQNSLFPAYRPSLPLAAGSADPLGWMDISEGIHKVGYADTGFSYDNERPSHRVFVEPCRIADRLISNGEYCEFIADGGYRRPELWLDLGWATVKREGWQEPLYWHGDPDSYSEFTLGGERDLCDAEPVAHVSYIEADAFARWAGARLSTEAEWEIACGTRPVEGNFVDSNRLHPDVAGARSGTGARQLFGDLWEWTCSSYSAYPGYRPDSGTLGEYNGKFMCNQFVLRGGSCASSRSHLRSTYRNFFYAPDRWQFTGIRLAKEFA